MRSNRVLIVGAMLLFIIPLTGIIWLSQNNSRPAAQVAAVPTLMATAPAPALKPAATAAPLQQAAQLPPTFTPVATVDGEPLPTLMPTAAPPILPTDTPAPLAMPSPTSAPPLQMEPGAEPPTVEADANEYPAAINGGDGCVEPPEVPDYPRGVLGEQIYPAPNNAAAANHFWLAKPFPGGGRYLTSYSAFPYGYDGGGLILLHNGVDAAAAAELPVLAAADGTIVVAQDDYSQQYGWRCNWYGHLVVLKLDQSWLGQPIYVLYGHIVNLLVEPGQRVSAGEQLAEVGIGGAATVPHLHLEVRVGENSFGATQNPMLWIQPATRGVVAGRLLSGDGRPWQGVPLSLIPRSEEAGSGYNSWSYQSDPAGIVTINPDLGWAENFVFADVKPGLYDVYAKIGESEYLAPVTVTAGQVSPVTITVNR